MQVILQSGGVGKRLHPLSLNKPKCFLKIKDKPIFYFQYKNLKKYNLHKELVIISNEKHVSYFENFFKNIKYKPTIISEKPGLGSGGSLIKNLRLLNKNFLLIYLDIFFDVNFSKFKNFKKNKNKIFAHKTTHKFDSDLVKIDNENKISKIYRKNKNQNVLSNISISGIFLLNRNLFIKPKIRKTDLTNIIIKNLKKHEFFIYFSNEKFEDFGTIERYKNLKKNYQKLSKQKALIFDRDGTIVSEKVYLNSKNKISFIPQFLKFIKKKQPQKYILICITNQPGIAKGFLTVPELEKIHDEINFKLQKKTGYFFDKFYYCPHYPTRGFKGEIKEFKINCSCRKPKPGLFKKAILEFNLKPKNILTVGNSNVDLVAAKRSGIIKNFIVKNNKNRSYNLLYKSLLKKN